MIQERLKRSNLIMLVVPMAVAGGAGPAAGDHLPAAPGADHAGSAFYELAVPWPDGLLHPLCGGGRARSAENLRSAVFLLLGVGVMVGLTLLRAHAGLWRAGGRGYLHQCYPRRAAKVPQPDDLADLGPDAWLTVRHRQWPRKFGRAAPGAEYGDLPACRLCVGRYRAAGAGRCENDDGT